MTSPTTPEPSAMPRPGPITRRLCGATLGAQALVVILGGLVAWQLERTLGDGDANHLLWGAAALAVLCIVAAAALRSRVGIWLGWLCQALTIASAVVLPAMLIVGVLFLILWWISLSNGLRIDADRAARSTQAD